MMLTVPQLAILRGSEYIAQIKLRLRDDAAWIDMLDPAIIERTAWGLNTLVASLDEQMARGTGMGMPDEAWIASMQTLRRLAVRRQETLEPAGRPLVASSRQTRAWQAFAAELAQMLANDGDDRLEGLTIPYGDLPVSDWLKARRERRSA